MIKVLFNGTPIYRLTFHREAYSHKKDGTPLYQTTAFIFIEGAQKGEPPVAKATARQYHKDRYEKEAARRAALRLLLDNRVRSEHDSKTVITDLDTDKLLGPTTFSRQERTAIWQSYLNRPRPKTTPSGPKGGNEQQLEAPKPQPTHTVVNKVMPIRLSWPRIW